MGSIIVYGSQYGSACRYAQELSKQTGVPFINYKKMPPLSDKQIVVYIGALYAGGVLGLSKTLKGLSLQNGQRLIIVTVGLADPQILQIQKNIRNTIQNQVSASLYTRAKIFHLRGAIDYQRLSWKHRTMMSLLHFFLQKKAAEEWSEEDSVLMETYNKQVDLIDFSSLRSIINEMQGNTNGKEL